MVRRSVNSRPDQSSPWLNRRGLFVFLFTVVGSFATSLSASDLTDTPTLRRPLAMFVDDSSPPQLIVANRCGTISRIDTRLAATKEPTTKERGAIGDETRIGKQLSWLTPCGGHRFLATDEANHELLLCRSGTNVQVLGRLRISPYPVHVVADVESSTCYVTSLWSRRVTEVELPKKDADDVASLRVVQEVDLPFVPRCQLLLPGLDRLLVADSFGSKIAIVDTKTFQIDKMREIPGHNIRGMTTSPDGRWLMLAHQMLNPAAHTYENDIHWGLLMSNDLRWLDLKRFISDEANIFKGAQMQPLGRPGRGGGDPSGLARSESGTVVVSLGAVHKVAVGTANDYELTKLSVGRRPTAVTIDPKSNRAYVANTFDDSVSLINLSDYRLERTLSLGQQRELKLAERGERLFHDGRLSMEGWMSCHSCHTDGHSNGMLNDNFSDGSFGAAKRVLSLRGAFSTSPYAWNGSVHEIQKQIGNSISVTMQRPHAKTPETLAAIEAYIQSLDIPPSLDALRGTADRDSIQRGAKVFERESCASCHRPPTYTSSDTYDVGLSDKQKNHKFNPPSLRGLSHRYRLFHDGSVTDLRDVFAIHQHQLEQPLSDQALDDLLAFLRSL